MKTEEQGSKFILEATNLKVRWNGPKWQVVVTVALVAAVVTVVTLLFR